MWRELVKSANSESLFVAGASVKQLEDVEIALGVALPLELRSLLLESNGIGNKYSTWVMSTEKMILRNREMREDFDQDDLYMPFDHLLCFSDLGNGDLAFFPIQGNGKINNPDIFVWDHENDSRRWIAHSLEDFVTEWCNG